ncbi:cell division protein FtsQ/DivIB [Marinomonas sp. 2405UD68-3]|uniref:cell division protein FtsQ/DivIB n=1 Tax=Marinomonas sp. 2405UD68-3 TaxID=3391835 RepID=UPI0039C9D1C6
MRILALFGASLLVILATFQGYIEKQDWFVIEHVSVKGNFQYTSDTQLLNFYNNLLGESLLSHSLDNLLVLATTPEWVKSASVRKIWPNSIQVYAVEHIPLAVWRDRNLITSNGQIITPIKVPNLPLPRLFGPEGTHKIVLEQFELVSQVLSSSDLRAVNLNLEARGAWSITLSNDLIVRLGRDDVLERLQRFIAVYKSDLSGRINKIVSIDARYPHGVSVEWKKEI